MVQNTSSAVMQRRREPSDSLDFFPTPAWATRALMEHVILPKMSVGRCLVWEPACGQGHMSKPLKDYFSHVIETDVYDHGYEGVELHDFLQPYRPGSYHDMAHLQGVDAVFTNPPFKLALEFIFRALQVAPVVGVLVRTSFLESKERYEQLYSKKPPRFVAQFVERVPMVKGRVDPTASSATSYCWLVFEREYTGPCEMIWIPSCRKKLEREGDYDA